jgi:hypothetical protein
MAVTEQFAASVIDGHPSRWPIPPYSRLLLRRKRKALIIDNAVLSGTSRNKHEAVSAREAAGSHD